MFHHGRGMHRKTHVYCRYCPKGSMGSNPIAISRAMAPRDATLPGEIKSDWSLLPDSFLSFFFPRSFLGLYFTHTNDPHSLSLQVEGSNWSADWKVDLPASGGVGSPPNTEHVCVWEGYGGAERNSNCKWPFFFFFGAELLLRVYRWPQRVAALFSARHAVEKAF